MYLVAFMPRAHAQPLTATLMIAHALWVGFPSFVGLPQNAKTLCSHHAFLAFCFRWHTCVVLFVAHYLNVDVSISKAKQCAVVGHP